MNRVNLQDRARILNCLVEGNSMRATTRMVGVSINTVTKLLVDAGAACSAYQNQTLKNLPCKRIQCDEIWSFCGMKEKNVPANRKGVLGFGDVYTWTAICADTKLVPSFMVGRRDAETANMFVQDLAWRMASRIQLTTDGNKRYLEAVDMGRSAWTLTTPWWRRCTAPRLVTMKSAATALDNAAAWFVASSAVGRTKCT